jgi:hypothetical protein
LAGGDAVTAATIAYADRNAGVNNKAVSLNSATINDGNGGANYTLTLAGNTTSTVTKASLGINAVTDSKVYDGNTSSAGLVTFTGLINGDSVSGVTQSFGSKNVQGVNGSTLLVNTGYSVNDGNSGGNYSVTTNTASGTISVRPLATWSGLGGDNLWSNPLNWDALPDLSNVSAVAITNGANVTYDNTVAGNTFLQSLGSNGTFVLGGGSLNLAAGGTGLSAAGYAQSGGTLSGSGNLTISNSFSQTGGAITLSSGTLADITQATGNLSITSLSAPTAKLTASTGSILGKLTAGSAQLTAATGIGTVSSPFQLAASNLTVTTTSNLNVTTTSGGINLSNTPTSAVTLIDFKTGDASALMYAQNGQDLTLTGTMSSFGGTVTIDPPVNFSMSNTAQVSSTGGAISLLSTGNVVLASVNAGSGTIGLSTGGSVTAASGFTGPSLIGATATLNIGGNAAFNTQVQTLNGTVNGTLTVVDAGGTAFTGTVGTTNTPIVAVQQVITTAITAISNSASSTTGSLAADSTSSSTSIVSIAANAVAAVSNTTGSAGATAAQTLLTLTGNSIGGIVGTFGESEPIDKPKVLNSQLVGTAPMSESTLPAEPIDKPKVPGSQLPETAPISESTSPMSQPTEAPYSNFGLTPNTPANLSGSGVTDETGGGTASKEDAAKKEGAPKRDDDKNNSKDKTNVKPAKC